MKDSKNSVQTGRKIKPVWVAGAIGAVAVIIIAVFMLMPKGLGIYTGDEGKTTLNFSGNTVTESTTNYSTGFGTGNGTKPYVITGTYKVSGSVIQFEFKAIQSPDTRKIYQISDLNATSGTLGDIEKKTGLTLDELSSIGTFIPDSNTAQLSSDKKTIQWNGSTYTK